MSSKNTNSQTNNSGAKDSSFGGQKRSLKSAEELKTKNDKGPTFEKVKTREHLDFIEYSQRYDRVQKAKKACGKEY